MAVGLEPPGDLLPVSGVRIGVAALGARREPRDDLAVFEIASGASTSATFTRNAFCAAPVTVARRHLAAAAPRFLLVNAGNANAGTGEPGVEAALACCRALAERAGVAPEAVLPFSTGVIGEPLPVARFDPAIACALGALAEPAWNLGARTIMTTDTVAKGASRRFVAGGRDCVVTGIAKGSGMIRPDMATMLAFVATDARVAEPVLTRALGEAVAASFNRITVDGDTSTNDACVLVATGAAGGTRLDDALGEDYRALRTAVGEVCLDLAHAIVRDGEGATKFVTVIVEGGAGEPECRAVADAVAHSPLVKTALFASDPNWGRILAAVGRSGVTDLDVGRVRVDIGGVCIVRDGARSPDYREEDGQRVFDAPEITIRIALGRGSASTTVWTCDFSHGYVTINAEYRS